MTADRIIPAAVAILFTISLTLWLAGGNVQGVQPRLPQTDHAAPGPTEAKPIKDTLRLVAGNGVPAADIPGAWPRFRGRNADGIAADEPELARTWGPKGPPVLWSISVGEGHAGPAVLNGRVYLLDYDQAERRDTLRCLSLADGRDIWRFSYAVEIMRQYGMSRTIPAVTDRFVVSFGPMCHVTCVDAATGQFKWAYDLAREFAAEVPRWYAGQCPLIDGDRAILAVGGADTLLMAVDCATGGIVWKTPNPDQWKTTHSSVIPMQFAGHRMYVYCASGGILGVSVEDGRVLWRTDEWRVPFASIPSPVIVGDGRIFLAGGYGAGSLMLRLKDSGAALTPEIVFRLDARTFSAEQHTPILYNGFVYGVTGDGPLACLDLAGNVVWSSGRGVKFGRGSYLVANGLLYAMNDGTGQLALIEATPSGYHELARAAVLTGPEVYGPMAIAGGRLLVRNLDTLSCLDVRKQP